MFVSFISPENLVTSVCFVSREWMKLANDDRSWEWRFKRELGFWDTYGYHPNFLKIPRVTSMPCAPASLYSYGPEETKNEIPDSSMSWKQWYLQQYLHNSKLYHSPQQALRRIISKSGSERSHSRSGNSMSVLSLPLRFPLQQSRGSNRSHIFRIPIFGQAMESSASGLLYNLMWAQESPLHVTGLYPGTDGIGSGVGFKVNSKRLNLAAIYGENPLETQQWRRFFEHADGLIYVVDAVITDEILSSAVSELTHALQTNLHAPLVVFCCESEADLTGELLMVKRTPFQIASVMNIKQDRKWCVQSVKTVADICRGLNWLSSVV